MPIGSSKALRSMLVHTCTVVQSSRGTATTGSYGHQSIDFTSGTTTTTGVRCRLEPMSMDERTNTQMQGTIVGDYNLYIAWESVPNGFLVQQSPALFRITSIVDSRTGASIDAGPFDINQVLNEAGESHHLKVVLKRVK